MLGLTNIPTNQTNIATSSQAELDQHDCRSLMELEGTAISPVKEAPIVDTKNLFVVDPDGKPHTGYAVTMASDIAEVTYISP